MSVKKYNQLIKEMHEGLDEVYEDLGGEVDKGEIAWEVTDCMLDDYPYIKKIMKTEYRITDEEIMRERLADDIYSGRGI